MVLTQLLLQAGERGCFFELRQRGFQLFVKHLALLDNGLSSLVPIGGPKWVGAPGPGLAGQLQVRGKIRSQQGTEKLSQPLLFGRKPLDKFFARAG